MRPSFHSLRMVHFSSKAISCPSRSASEPPVESSEDREAEREDGDFLVGVGAGRLSPGCGAADASM